MTVSIAEQKGTFYLKGNLNSSTPNLLGHHLTYLLKVQVEMRMIQDAKKKKNHNTVAQAK